MRNWSLIATAAATCVCCVLPAYEGKNMSSDGGKGGSGGTKTNGGRAGEPIGGDADGGTVSNGGVGNTAGTHVGAGAGGNPGGGAAGAYNGAGASTAGASTGGASGGGASGGGAGNGMGGGAGAGGSSDCVAPTAATGLISNFDATNTANQLSGGTDIWITSPTGSNVATATGGVLKVKQTAGSWGGVSTNVNKGVECLDLDGKYLGVRFKMSSPVNTQIKLVVVTPETLVDYSHYGKIIAVSPSVVEFSVLFSSLDKSAWGAGFALPADYNPAQHVVGLGFGVMEEKENMDLTLDDVTFF